MSAGDWSRLKTIFQELLGLPRTERDAFLKRLQDEDESIAREVLRLYTAHNRAGNFLERPITGEISELLMVRDLQELERDLEGRFRFINILGEGGMGYVLLVEQLHPVKRQAALKLMKPGTSGPETLTRFKDERQALAMMNHPHIAQIYEAGATRGGRPYFVMEHVEGIPINLYRERRALSIEQTLKLFEKLCHAVQHAHQRGIVHRDLKPSNVLVSGSNDPPVPKVIDFGIARPTALHSQAGNQEPEPVIGTPAYMSPEQVDPSLRDIDTRCDIYALGVMLYQLLTGKLPLEAPTRQALILKILAQPPELASQTVQKIAAEQKSKGRSDERLPALANRLRGDLDAILAKALQKNPEHRYDSASAFAEDLKRHRLVVPVTARAPSPYVRLGKFFRRHKRLTPAFFAIGAILTLNLLALLVGWRHASRLRQQALALLNEARAEQALEQRHFYLLSEALKPLSNDFPVSEMTLEDLSRPALEKAAPQQAD